MGNLIVVVGGQFGSEGKGAVVGALARDREESLAVVRVGGPNAGHTVHDDDDRIWKLRHIPVAAVTNPEAILLLGPGSEVDGYVLDDEIKTLEKAGYKIAERLVVDRSATLLEGKHAESEQQLIERIGSTGKGIGAARSDRIMRIADIFGGVGDVRDWIRFTLAAGGTVLVEGTQGYGLGLHTEYYPHCTSSDCDAMAMLAMAGAVPWAPEVTTFEVWVVLRTLPIRVAGNSGPLRGETTWSELGIPAEHTTVTQKVRRVGTWDPQLAMKALEANGGPSRNMRVVLTGLDLVVPGLAEMRQKWTRIDDLRGSDAAWTWLMEREEELGCEFAAVGIGPGQGDLLWR